MTGGLPDRVGVPTTTEVTRATYDAIAARYAQRWVSQPDWMAGELDWLSAMLPPGARVADIGCGPGHHTRLLRDCGLLVAGFDLSWHMLGMCRASGVAQADMRALPVATGALDAIWCVAALLHIPRPEVPGVLAEFARALRPRGCLALSVAEGDGEGWEEVPYAAGRQRWYVRHRIEGLHAVLTEAGFAVTGCSRDSTHRDWLRLRARRAG